jgi:hypothetical protein
MAETGIGLEGGIGALEDFVGEDAVAVETLDHVGGWRAGFGEAGGQGGFGFGTARQFTGQTGSGFGQVILFAGEFEVAQVSVERQFGREVGFDEFLGIVEGELAAIEEAAGGGDQLIGLFFSEIGAGDALAEDDGVLGVGESGAGFVELDRGRDTGSYQGLDTLNLHARTENVGIFLG